MLTLKHQQSHNNRKHLLTDVSFVLAKKGFTSICFNKASEAKRFAYHLCGLEMDDGEIFLNDQLIVDGDDYRKHFCYGIVSDFLLRDDMRVIDVLTYPGVDKDKLRKLLFDYHLLDVSQDLLTTLTLEQQTRVVVVSCLLRDYKMIVFYPDGSDYSLAECKLIYQELVKVANLLQVVIVDDKQANYYATRKVYIKDGLIISDSNYFNQKEEVKLNVRKDEDITSLLGLLRKKYRIFYRMLFIALVLLMSFSAIFMCTLTMDEVRVQSDMALKQQGEIPLIMNLKQPEISNDLQNKLQGNLIKEYDIIDQDYALAYLCGYYGKVSENKPLASDFKVVEGMNKTLIINDLVAGKSNCEENEVILSLQSASTIINQVKNPQLYLGDHFDWYGSSLTIVGIIKDKQQHQNRLYVSNEYIKNHALNKMQVFDDTLIDIYLDDNSYQIERIQSHKRIFNYFSDKGIKYEFDEVDGAVLSYATALQLGFESKIKVNNYVDYLAFLEEYKTFIEPYLNEKVIVNAYQKDYANNKDPWFKQALSIKGFVYPVYDDIRNNTYSHQNNIYIHEELIQSYQVNNLKLNQITYYSDNADNYYLDFKIISKNKDIIIDLAKRNILKVLLLDFQDIAGFIIGIFMFILFLVYMIYYKLVSKTLAYGKDKVSYYYRLGLSKQKLKQTYRKLYLRKIQKYLIWALIIAMVIQGTYIYLIVSVLYTSKYYYTYLGLPPMMALILYGLFLLMNHYLIKDDRILIEEYGGKSDE